MPCARAISDCRKDRNLICPAFSFSRDTDRDLDEKKKNARFSRVPARLITSADDARSFLIMGDADVTDHAREINLDVTHQSYSSDSCGTYMKLKP